MARALLRFMSGDDSDLAYAGALVVSHACIDLSVMRKIAKIWYDSQPKKH